MPICTIAAAAFTPSSRLSNRTTAADIFSGIPKMRRVSSVMIPKVPSEPTINLVRSYPADNFLVGRPVLMIVPSDKTTVIAKTFSRIDPYLTVVVPEAPVDAIPPNVASAPGSTEKNKPRFASFSLSATRRTPPSTRTNKSSGAISIIVFISEISKLIPPNIGSTCPSNEVPAPNGTTGMFCS